MPEFQQSVEEDLKVRVHLGHRVRSCLKNSFMMVEQRKGREGGKRKEELA